jgi:dTMP kinase
MSKGMFITFEGIDGSGKTTAAKRVVEELKSKGFKAMYTCEPTGTSVGEAVKAGYEEEVNPFMELLLFLADRAAHTKEIQKWIEEGNIVICDRYADSTYAYQAVTLEKELTDVEIEPLEWLKRISQPFIIKPEITFLLLVKPRDALNRIRRKGTKFEKEQFLDKVHDVYMRLAEEDSRFITIDAARPLSKVIELCTNILLTRLGDTPLENLTPEKGLGE